MLTIDEALTLIQQTLAPSPAVALPLVQCLGLTLAEDIISAIESPPFDKALMDGYAVCASDVATGQATLTVLERITAGMTPQQTVRAGFATQIMTGAPLPAGADAVVRIEDTREDGDRVVINSAPVTVGQDLIRKGAALRIGETVLIRGMALTPSRIGALAELGVATPMVHPRPTVAVLATGDELVPVDQMPGPGQIRNSNESMLVAQLQSYGVNTQPLGIARDDRAELASRIEAGLQADVLVLSGGVSAGKLDLVPSTLAAAGVEQVFHKVDLKPGKPIWFGVKKRPDGAACAVFGLPGNPVSSMVCCELFVRTALRRLMGQREARPLAEAARLTHPYRMQSDRP
ncbi:MAG TPA: gephyrin-like molybdotransferase Glp, partial [Planctomycetaceae bacterium]|nr:gephyrin-like molybdotransferase Glp [Planctomycetaceae bacterium]